MPNTIPVGRVLSKNYDKHEILFLGRICEAKGIRELVQAIKIVSASYPDVHLYLGGIYEDPELKNLIDENSELITHLGWVNSDEKEKWLERCPFFVLPTYFEGQPVSILEAMSHSCAIVASEVGGIPMMIQNNVNGALVPPKNAKALADAFLSLFKDPALCCKYGKCAYEKVLTDFSIEKTIEELTNIYENLFSPADRI